GINLLPLATFAMDTYGDDPCTIFNPRVKYADEPYDGKTVKRIAQMQKAIAIIQFKLEAEIINRHPEYGMDDRNLLHLIDFEKGVLKYNGKEYKMLDMNLPTVDPKNPYKLSAEEEELMDKIYFSFRNSEKLHKHMRCLYANGSMYNVANGNLLYHASIPLTKDGQFKEVTIGKSKYKGKALLDRIDQLVRAAYFGEPGDKSTIFAQDYMWYLWCGKDSPIFDKSKMATFERYFVAEKELHKEVKGHYYSYRDSLETCNMILDEFGACEPHSHIINGHVPVKTTKGEEPTKAGGKLLVIDGGFSRAYQPATGIAGYTLVFNSRGMQLVQHAPFESRQKAIEEGIDIRSTSFLVEMATRRMMVRDTDIGKELIVQIQDLEKLLVAYRLGLIKQKRRKYPKVYFK
ncbi:MAG: fructose-bisphosphatase class III, partial [Bacteroides sp.]